MSSLVEISRPVVTQLLVQGKRTAQVLSKPRSPTITIVRSASPVPVAGSGSSGFEFLQVSAASTWTINHNLGRNPSVTVLSPGGIEVEAQVNHTSLNQTVVQFKLPYAGKAVMR